MTTTGIRFSLTASAVALLLAMSTTMTGQTPGKAAIAPADTYREIYQGWKWWHVYCYRCHGVDALGTTTAPNLTDPTGKVTRAEFLRIVRNGVPKTALMPPAAPATSKVLRSIALKWKN